MAGKIVDDDDIARLQSGRQNLLDIGKKAAAIDGTVDDARRIDSIAAQGGKEGHCPPVTIGRFGEQPFPSGAPAVGARHVGLGPGLVDKDQMRCIKPALVLLPLFAPFGDIRTVLLRSVQAFF